MSRVEMAAGFFSGLQKCINPLLYDFRAHNRAKEGGKDRKGRLEEGSKRIKPCVIKQPDRQQRQEVMEEGREKKLDEREEDNEGGQAGNPMEVISDCNGSGTVLQRCGCRDESTLKLASEGHLETTPDLREMWGRRRRKRGGVRKKDRRKTGEKTQGENKIINGPFENLKRGEDTDKEERSERGILSNLGAHRMDGGRKMGIREERRKIQGDQIEPERAGRNDKKTGELLSDLPLNRCNRCNQLCAQVKREANRRQFQQSDSGWGQELRTLLCGGEKRNSMISPSSESVLQMPCCPAITPSLAREEMGDGCTFPPAGCQDSDRTQNIPPPQNRREATGSNNIYSEVFDHSYFSPLCRNGSWLPETHQTS
ncbi:unnamed protein product [Tetraodon nigroviridis]|uniref:(spotted green pufferfish) hypothetical protein n=1 Tax=Tetraodon nigroviridis TaxID=99883 RepID=Q4SG96_TETNG|nr:unnamed protein product [Tetraodon nigroviridis]